MKSITLTKGYETMVDDEDYVSLSRHRWSAYKNRGGYVYAGRTVTVNGHKHFVLMHRHLLNATDRLTFVDHKDRNTLNNTRDNLRLATHSQNIANSKKRSDGTSSRFKGVSVPSDNHRKKKWCAFVTEAGRRRMIGRYYYELAAAAAYNAAACRLYGEFALLNNLAA